MKVLRWLATPEMEREPKTLEDLATEIGVCPATILKWRSRKLDALAAEETRMKLFEHLPEVYDVLAKQAAAGSPEHMKLFLTVARGHEVPPTAPTAPDGPTALMGTEGNARIKKETMMSKTDGWYEGGNLVMQYTFSYKDALDMAEFKELMSCVVEADVEALAVRSMRVHYQDDYVQVTARVDDNPALLTRPTLDRRHSPWQGC